MVFFIQHTLCGYPAFQSFRFLPQSIFENPETTENFHKLIFRGIKTIYLISSTFLGILCDQDLTFKCCSKLSRRTYHLSLKVAFLLLKSKLYLENKVITFQQFCNNNKPLTLGALLIQKPFCRLPAFPSFRFFPYSIFKNTETTENFQKLIFRGIKTIYLILRSHLGILYFQNKIYKVLLKVINEHLLLFL